MLALLATAACNDDSGDKSSSDAKPSTSLGSQDSSQSTTANVVVKETGLADGSMYVYLENRESREIAVKPGFVGYDAAGNKFDDVGSPQAYIMEPNSTTLLSSSYTEKAMVRVEAKPKVEAGIEIPTHGPGGLEASATISLGAAHVTVKSSYQQAVNGIAVTVACKDSAGKLNHIVIHSLLHSEVNVPKAGTTTFDTGLGRSYPRTCDAYPHIMPKTTFSD